MWSETYCCEHSPEQSRWSPASETKTESSSAFHHRYRRRQHEHQQKRTQSVKRPPNWASRWESQLQAAPWSTGIYWWLQGQKPPQPLKSNQPVNHSSLQRKSSCLFKWLRWLCVRVLDEIVQQEKETEFQITPALRNILAVLRKNDQKTSFSRLTPWLMYSC